MITSRGLAHLFVVAAVGMLADTAFGHARLSATGNFPPRSADSGIQAGPCGSAAKIAPVAFKSGQTVALQWEETIHHSGRFQAFISTGGDVGLSTGTASGAIKLFDVAQSFNDGNVPHEYSQQVVLPNITCADCTIQLVQVNTDGSSTNPVYYFSCSDVQLTAVAPVATPTPVPIATPVPSASPVAVACLPGATATPIPATFTAVKANILTPLCVTCHQGSNPPDGFNFSTYGGVFSSVNVKTPAMSLIYTTTLDGAMPEGGAPLTTLQQDLLLRWIQAGAPNN